MKKAIVLLTLASMAAVGAAQSGKVTLRVGDPAPAISVVKWAKGTPVKSVKDGKIYVVEFWATWCGPCRESIPHLTKLAKQYQGKATFIGVDSFEREPDPATRYKNVEKFVADFGDKMNYNVAIDSVQGVMGKTWMDAAGQEGIPTAFVVDKTGKIAWIGHPMSLDSVIGNVVSGKFDVAAEAKKQKAAQDAEAAERSAQMKELAPILEAMRAKDYKKVVSAIDDLVKANPSRKPMLAAPRLTSLAKYDVPAASKYGLELADTLYKGNAQGLNQIAWMMVEDGSPFLKGGDTAISVKIAEQAVQASNDDPMIMDTLALAYFRAGRTADAITTEQKAVTKASADAKFDAATLKEIKDRLASFQKATKS